MAGNQNGNGAAAKVHSYVLSLGYSAETHQVTIGGDPMPISLAQMICDEALRLLEEQRRISAARLLRDTLEREADGRNLAAKIMGGRA